MLLCRENCGSFPKAYLRIGLQEAEASGFEDVYEDRNMGQFLPNIISLARFVQFQSDYKGPQLPDVTNNSGPGGYGGPAVGSPDFHRIRVIS
jgi:hypothetical protein